MKIKEYIESGILELYVYGALEEAESKEVKKKIDLHPELQAEVEAIELALHRLASGTASYLPATNYAKIKAQLFKKNQPKSKIIRLIPIIGYAAGLSLFVTLSGIFYVENQSVKQELEQIVNTKERIELENERLVSLEQEYQSKIDFLTDKNTKAILLPGQGNYQESFAQAFLNTSDNKVVIDLKGLPEAPKGMVYQLWSLELNPLTPTSLGLLEPPTGNNFVSININPNLTTEAFGITLEPAGGSATPTLERLYTLGKV